VSSLTKTRVPCAAIFASSNHLLLAVLLVCGGKVAVAQIPRRPNILVIVADDLGWADVGYHNPEMRTPNIDSLVQTGVELDCHYVMPVCTPTRVALLTGRYPSRFGSHCTQPSNEQALPYGTQTLASLLREEGYDTAIVGKWHLGSKPEWGPNHYGFAYSYGSLAGGMAPYDHRYRLTRPEFTKTFHRNHEFIEEPGHSTDLMADEAIGWIEKERESPFFLYVPFQAVHVPLVEVPHWWAKNEHISSADRRQFAAATTHMDDAIGRIIEALERTGQRENTLLVFFSDNGALTNHVGGKYPPPDPPLTNFSSNAPLHGQKAETYEGGIRVPAFVNWPAFLQPRKITTPLHVVDWMPTFAEIAEVDNFDGLTDGQVIWPLLTGREETWSPRTFYWVVNEERRWVALRHGDWKIVRHREHSWELFNLANDPGESVNLADQLPSRLEELKERYRDQWARDGGTATLFDGKTLKNWTTLDGDPVTTGWEIVDGVIHLDPSQRRVGHIMTKRPFADFRLSFEWKIVTGGNSGLKYRVRDYSGKWRGCEYQVLDDAGYGKAFSLRNSVGALYDLYAPNDKKRLRSVGKFNSSKIVVHNNRIQHWLNGELILSAQVGDQEWHDRVAKSKFSDLEGFGENEIGRIMLTDHGSEVWFRNFDFEPLP